MAIEIRTLSEGDLSRLPRLYREVFQVDTSPALWRWKYFENPAGDHLMRVAVDTERSDELIGQVGTIPVRMVVGDHVMLGAQTCDIVILPQYQKGGPFFKLHEQSARDNLERGVQFIFGYSVPKTLKISTRILKFTPVAPIRRLVKVLDPTPFLREKAGSGWIAKAIGPVAKKAVHWNASRRLRLAAGETLTEVKAFDSRYEAVIRSWMTGDGVLVYRDAAYLNWRYLRHPTAHYRVYAFESRGEVLGWTVVAVEDGSIRRAYLLELIGRRGMSRAADLLLGQAIQYCLDEGVATLSAWFFEHSPVWRVFRRRGFAVRETSHHLIVRPHFPEPVPMSIEAARHWEISMGDSDYH